jgi:hypothetical protein
LFVEFESGCIRYIYGKEGKESYRRIPFFLIYRILHCAKCAGGERGGVMYDVSGKYRIRKVTNDEFAGNEIIFPKK